MIEQPMLNAVGDFINSENISSLFNAGLTVGANALQNKANKESEERALEIERLRLQQIQASNAMTAAAAANAAVDDSKGLSTGAWVGIIGGSVLVLGLIIYLIVRKK